MRDFNCACAYLAVNLAISNQQILNRPDLVTYWTWRKVQSRLMTKFQNSTTPVAITFAPL